MNKKRIETDLKQAKYIINDTESNDFDIDLASYLIQQSIEKTLKYILHNIYNQDETTKKYRTHNINSLIIQLNKIDANFIDKHKDIVKISDKLTSWEANCRYSDENIATKEDVVNAYNYAKNFYNELIEYEKNHLSGISIFQSKENINIEDYNSQNFKDENKYINTNIKLDKQEKLEIDNINNDSKIILITIQK